jgi:hypothetical protein
MEEDLKPALLRTLEQDRFDELAARAPDSIVEALRTGEDERGRAQAELRPALIETNLRFA